MPARSQVPTAQRLPGATLVGLLAVTLAMLIGVSFLAWRSVRASHDTSPQRGLELWIPVVATLAIAMAVLALLLLRTQARAREDDFTRFRAIFDNTFQFISLLKPDGTLLEANRTALDFAGIASDDVLGRPFWEAPWWSASDATREQLKAAIDSAAAGDFVRYPVEVVGANGRRLVIDFSLKPVLDAQGRVQFIVPEGRDVTALRATEQALAESEERWNFALTGSALGVWDWAADRNVVYYSDRWKEMLGYAPNEIGDQFAEWTDRVHPDDLELVLATLQEHLDGKSAIFVSIYRMRAKDGSYREVIDRGKVVARDVKGRPLRVIGTQEDITDQREAEATARLLQQQLSALMRFSPTLISVIDRDGRYLQASDSIAAAISRPVRDIIGKTIHELLPAEMAANFAKRLSEVAAAGRPIDVEDTVGPPGSERRYRTVLFPLRDEAGQLFATGTVAVDITEAHNARRRLEQLLDEHRVLQGLLSICAQCKRIRDLDDDQWKPVEAYVQSHTAATFSHGLCPSCTETWIRESGLDDEA